MLSLNELCNLFLYALSFLFIKSKAFHVFSMRVATVIGHTHPGTGETQYATFSTDTKSTSPYAFPSTNVHPTSIIIEPVFTISPFIYPGFQLLL